MPGITMEDLGEDVTLEASSMLRRYVATKFKIIEKQKQVVLISLIYYDVLS